MVMFEGANEHTEAHQPIILLRHKELVHGVDEFALTLPRRHDHGHHFRIILDLFFRHATLVLVVVKVDGCVFIQLLRQYSTPREEALCLDNLIRFDATLFELIKQHFSDSVSDLSVRQRWLSYSRLHQDVHERDKLVSLDLGGA